MSQEKLQTYEEQYGIVFDVEKKFGRTKLGLMINESWNQDPKRTLFTLSRYKFVAKMLSGADNVLEVGCADAFGTRVVQQEVGKITAIDIDEVFVNDALSRMVDGWDFSCFVHDILEQPVIGQFDAAYCLDVFEHIPNKYEDLFLENIKASVGQKGVVIIGIPSIESQFYASPQSKIGHVNCKSGNEFKCLLKNHFSAVFLFSMNDEVVHTGYYPMAHYLLAVCVI